MPIIRLLLIDQNEVFAERIRLTLQSQLDIDIVAYTTQTDNLLQLCAENTPHIIMLGQVDSDSLALIRTIRTHYPETRIISIAKQLDTQHARQHLNAGVTGYLLLDDVFSRLSDSIWTAHLGKSVISTEVTRALL